MLSSWKTCCARIPQRWLFAVMGCLATTLIFSMRNCLSTAITEMVITATSSSNSTTSDDTCPSTESTSSTTSSSSGIYEWDEYTQGLILSSFFWGQVITPIPGGILADKYGGKQILGFCILTISIFSLLTPVVVQTFDATGLMVLRVLMGLCSGIFFPALNSLISQWAPPQEISKIDALVLSGIQIGTVLGSALSGFLIGYSSIGWPIVFYVFGAIGLLFYPFWILLCYDKPDTHPFISEKEQNYLDVSTSDQRHKRTIQVPWRHILTSRSVWALLFGRVGYSWGLYTMVTNLPKYMKSILKFSIQTNGLLTAFPYVILFFVSNGTAWLADWLIKAGKLSCKNMRKIFMTIASVAAAVFMIAASYAGCDRVLVVVCFTAGIGVMGLFYPSVIVNQLDLAPNYCGSIVALADTVTSLLAILAPYMVGVLTPNQTLPEWRIIFWITFALYVVSVTMYNIWADGEVQYWNDPDFRDNPIHKKKMRVNPNVSASG
ncbi:putative inorganic phosphate cotransporter [Diprion similis]|uniref:putative inorganic phosphate cotransporter n=1 Tax=Diprion similis TaxID=362088 RepID=UPI001EF9A04C|nr:putative inorganic phosphate cotransporter [Diprion similis]